MGANDEKVHPSIERVILNIERVMIGKRQATMLALTALFAEGHVLLEDVPGVGKTMLVRAIAKSLGTEFKRIQFTPDLLPSDLTGLSVYNQKEMTFEFRPGPLMGNVVLADEINRTSPKTQSALLEGMEEGSVTVDGQTRVLPKPFFVMATQNPIEYEGTYPLPEAQLDRFLLKLKMGYPSRAEELEVLNRLEAYHPIETIDSVLSIEEVLELQAAARSVYVDESIKNYLIDIVSRTRGHHQVYLGVSPRGSLALLKTAQAYAMMHDRKYVVPDDVKSLAPFVLGHRLILKPDAKYSGVKPEDIVADIIKTVQVPVPREGSLK
ncbi:MoxR-like ATPase [Pullulanibacillus pueri]|uniref:Magnesium chelatase n=1 Tax=Pullulanibacillus pueri TaxID=1437324 RepID=A0A8J2ZWB2_9BACL|nr:MoxR family ATPase [Pullulanibacillus pueri]MBM7682784.1 MoxR-like ATPase [Pullulanibacillus pueri]GGH83170.1 magnesium chelatase [Pullulanibacillus pueri]